MKDAVFKQKIRSVMIDNKSDRIIPKRKKGKLDGANSWRAHAGSERIFKQKQERKGKNYSIILLLDQSGSMWNTGVITHLAKAVSELGPILQDEGVEVSIIGFNEGITCYKEFSQKMPEVDYLFDSLSCDTTAEKTTPSKRCCKKPPNNMAGNHDYDAVELALDILSKRKGNKILMTFSDGRPHCDWPENCGYPQELHDPKVIHNLILSYPKIVSVGIGLKDNTVSKIYPKSIVLDSMNKLKPEVIKFFRANIKRM